MNLIRIPIPDNYEYIDTDKIISMRFDAYNGTLTICFEHDYIKTYYDGAKRVLDKILQETRCSDGIPNIPKKEKQEVDKANIIDVVEESSLCELIR